MNLKIRLEEKNDYKKVEELIRDSFWNFYVPGANEHYLVHSLRHSSIAVPKLNFIAIKDNKIVGQIFYTTAKIVDNKGNSHEVLTFGPLCVDSKYRNLGIGKFLINHTKKIAANIGYKAIVIYGYPEYYHKIGFQNAFNFGIARADGVFAKALLAIELYPNSLNGISGNFYEAISSFEYDEAEFLKFDSLFSLKEKKYEPSQDLFLKMIDETF